MRLSTLIRESLIQRGRRYSSLLAYRKSAALLIIFALLSPTSTMAGQAALAFISRNYSTGPLTSATATLAVLFRSLLIKPQSTGKGMPADTQPHSPRMLVQPTLTMADRKTSVARLETTPRSEITLESEQPFIFSAIPMTSSDEAIQGLAAQWQSSNPQIVSIQGNGEATAGSPGLAQITASIDNKQASILVNVVPRTGGPFGGKKPTSTRSETGAGSFAPQHKDSSFELALHRKRASKVSKSGADAGKEMMTFTPKPLRSPDDDPLPDTETKSLYTPVNKVGHPKGRTEMSAMTVAAATSNSGETPLSSNFNFAVPVANLPGRGLDVSLSLAYNSRLWHLSQTPSGGNQLTYDVDSGWPAPGFRLGFGQMEDQGSYGFTLTDPDGTRHPMVKTNPSNPSDYNYDSTDSTFIHFYGGRGWGTVTYTDGTRIEYGAAGNGFRSYPTKITDSNGNYILISYRDSSNQPVGPRISSIQDTLERYVLFKYSGSDLVAVTVPNLAGAANAENTTIRFYYTDIDLSIGQIANLFGIASATVHHPNVARVINYVYFPATQSGYRYDYSPYGMIRQITQLRAMQVSYNGWDQLGSVNSDGQVAATTLYDYPNEPRTLMDVPGYQHRTDDWTGGNSTHPDYFFSSGSTPGNSTITALDGTATDTLTIVTGVEAEQWKNGLVSDTTIRDGGLVLSKTHIDWEPSGTNPDGSFKNPRIHQVQTTNEAGETTTIVYDQYDAFNNVTRMSFHGFSAPGTVGAELRRVETDYVTDSRWTGRNLLRLPASVRVVAPSGTVVSRTEFAYDWDGVAANLTGRGATPVPMHDQTYNPQSQSYSTGTVYRGNVTRVTSYAYPGQTVSSSAGASVTENYFDILGNVVKATVNCCRVKTFGYTAAYKYGYTEAVTRGDLSGPHLTTSASYDFNTGLLRTTNDENQQETTYQYYADSLRLSEIYRPDGGATFFNYSDTFFPNPDSAHGHSFINKRIQPNANSPETIDHYQFMDGRGAVVRTYSKWTASNGWETTDIEYDLMGRATRMSNPYYSGGAGDYASGSVWTTTLFDGLGRMKSLTMPSGDAGSGLTSETHADYAGTVVTLTDAAGRQRRQIADALGRIVKVDEPDASGNLGSVNSPSQRTTYDYDELDNLKTITQDVPGVATQVRSFRHDALGHLTHQKQVEAAAKLDNNGTVTQTGIWSNVLQYDDHGLLTDAFDSRGAHTQLAYDELNRLKTVSYSDGTPSVTYTYDQPGSGQTFYNNGRLTEVKTAAATVNGIAVPETRQHYDYDRVGQVVSQKQTVGTATYTLEYGYNVAGELTSEKYPSGRVVSYGLDEAGRMLSVADATRTYASAMTYGPHGGMLSETLGNGAAESVVYNNRLQVSSLSLTKQNALLQRYEYKYGVVNQSTGAVDETKNAGQIARIESWIDGADAAHKQWQQRFTYDPLGRLTQSSEYRADTGALSYKALYDFDRFGNRYQKAASQDHPLPYAPVEDADISKQTNRFTAGVTYDDAGNVTLDQKFRGMQYRFDASGRQIWSANADNTAPFAAVYDGAGQRVQTTNLTTNASRISVYDIFGRVVAEYGDAEGGEGGLHYLMTDVQGSTRVAMNSVGSVISRHDYEAFGKEIGAGTGQRTTTQKYNSTLETTKQLYAGMEKDAATGLDHALWRKYEEGAGRWTTPDPYLGNISISNPQSFNRYAYVQNDPVNFVDPTGLDKDAPWDPSDTIVINIYASNGVYNPFWFGADWFYWSGETGRLDEPFIEFGGSNKTDPIEQSRTDVVNILSTKNPCSDFFGGSAQALSVFNQINFRAGTVNNPKLDAKANARIGIQMNVPEYSGKLPPFRLPNSATVNNSGAFFKNFYPGSSERLPAIGGYGSTSREARALMLLHELAHLISKPDGSDWLIRADGAAPNQSEKNTDAIKAACKDQIDAIQ